LSSASFSSSQEEFNNIIKEAEEEVKNDTQMIAVNPLVGMDFKRNK